MTDMKTNLTILVLLSSLLCARAQNWTWEENQLSYAREGLFATVMDDSIFFSGGRLYDYSFVNTVDIYDIGEDTWSTVELETPARWVSSVVSTGGKVFIAGGENYPNNPLVYYSEIDIYSKSTGEWTVETLPDTRAYMSAIALGNKVFFAGGGKFTSGGSVIYYDEVSIYDAQAEAWLETEYLSEPKVLPGAAASGSKVFFAGGETGENEVSPWVDIYDTLTGTWTYKSLSEGRTYIAAAAYGNKVYFAGGARPFGVTSLNIDVYNVDIGDWEEELLYLQNSRIVTALNVCDALVFTGHVDYVDLYNHTWGPRNGTVEVYYPGTGEWDYSVDALNPPRMWYAFAAHDDKAYYAGGWGGGDTLTGKVSVLAYDCPTGVSIGKNFREMNALVYPNPFQSTLRIEYTLQHPGNVSIILYNHLGEQVEALVSESRQQGTRQEQFNVGHLASGVYFLELKTHEGIQSMKIIKLR